MPAGLLYLPANSPKYAATRSPLWFVLGASSETTAAVRAQFQVVFSGTCGGGATVIMDLGDVTITMSASALPGTAGTTFNTALSISTQAQAFFNGVKLNYTLTQRYTITFDGISSITFVARNLGAAGNCAVSGTAPVSQTVDYSGTDAVTVPNYSVGLRIWDSTSGTTLVTELSGVPNWNNEVEWDLSTILGAQLKPDMPEYSFYAVYPLLHYNSTRTFYFQWWQRYGTPPVNWQVTDWWSATAPCFAVLAGHSRANAVEYDAFITEATGTTYPKPFLTWRQRYGKRIVSTTEQHYLAFHHAEGIGDEEQVFMQARVHYTDVDGTNPVTTSWSTRYTDASAIYPGYVCDWPTGYAALNLAALLPSGKVMQWYEVRLYWTQTSAAISEVLRFHVEQPDYNEQHLLFWSSLGAPESLRATGAWELTEEGSNPERYNVPTRVYRADMRAGTLDTTPGTTQRTITIHVASPSLQDHQAVLDIANSPCVQLVDHVRERHLPLRLLTHKATVEQRGTEDEHLYLLDLEFLLDDPAETVTLAP